MRSLDPLQGQVNPFERRLAGDRTPVGDAERHPRRPLDRIVEALLERRREEVEEIHPIARRPLPGEGIDEPADGERVAEERFGGDHAIDLAENIGDLLRSLAVGPLEIGRADVEPPHRLVEVVEGALRGAPGGENVRLPVIRLEPQRHESEDHKQPNRQGAGDPGVAEGEVDAAGDVVELAADHLAAGTAGEDAAPGGNAAQRQHRQHRHPRAGDADHARPAEVADHLMARQRQRRHPDRGRDHRQETGHADGPQRPPAGLARRQPSSEPAADVDHHVNRIGKADEAQQHREDDMAEGIVLEADRADEPERPEDPQCRRCGRHEDDREPPEEDGGEGEDQAVADKLEEPFVGVAVAHPFQPDRYRAGEGHRDRHLGMLGRRGLGRLHEGCGDVGLVLDQRPVVGDQKEERLGVGGEELADNERMVEGLGTGDLEALRRGRAAREDRLVEAEDVERRGPVEPGDPRHRVEAFQALDDMPEGDGPFAREHLRAFHHHDRVGPAEGRAPAAPCAPRPPPGDLGARGPRRPPCSAGRPVLDGAIVLLCLPPRSLPD